MNCHYCEEAIHETQESSEMYNNKNKEVISLHYPNCKVEFTTFYKTKKEFEQFKVNGYKQIEQMEKGEIPKKTGRELLNDLQEN